MAKYLDKSGLEVYHNNAVKKFADKSEVADILEKVKKLEHINDGGENSNITFEDTYFLNECNTIVDALRVLDRLFYKLHFEDGDGISTNMHPFYIESLEDENVVYDSNISCRLSINSEDVEYSYGDIWEWKSLSNVENITLNKNERVYFRYAGDGCLGYYGGEDVDLKSDTFKNTLRLTETTKTFNVGGDIRNIYYGNETDDHMNCFLVNGFRQEGVITGEFHCLGYLFYKSKVVNADKLLIPFKKIEDNGCKYMFASCSNLISAPYLPATDVGVNGYRAMFASCVNLIVAPELPATIVGYNSYNNMFASCVNLIVAPKYLPAQLAEYCYSSMFYNCSSLTTAPELPAKVLTQGCYGSMFLKCSSLNYIKCLATSNISIGLMTGGSTVGWLAGVSQNGTFVKTAGVEWSTGSGGIPTNWTVEEV